MGHILKKQMPSIYLYLVMLLVIAGLPMASANITAVASSTNNDPSCINVTGPLRGVFGIGTMGPTCPAVPMGAQPLSQIMYSDFIVDGSKVEINTDTISKENARQFKLTETASDYIIQYGVQIVNLIDQLAYDYLREQELLEAPERQSKPASNEEIAAWQLLVKVVAYQESLFSHYQMSDKRESKNQDKTATDHDIDARLLRVLVGDPVYERVCTAVEDTKKCRVKLGKAARPISKQDHRGNPIFAAIGMFQLHASRTGLPLKLRKDELDLVKNIEYGMDYLYPRWSQILGYRPLRSLPVRLNYLSCKNKILKKDKIDYFSAIRSVYGMYNGGDSKICRFVKSELQNKNYENENRDCMVGMVSYSNEAHKRRCESKQKCGSFACPWVIDTRIRNISESKPWEAKFNLSDASRATKYQSKIGRYHFKFDLDCIRDKGEFCFNE